MVNHLPRPRVGANVGHYSNLYSDWKSSMRTVSVKWFVLILALAWIGLAQLTYADDALTARNKVIVRDFYTTVLINRQIDAAPRFLRPDMRGSTVRRSASTCFESGMARLRSIGMPTINPEGRDLERTVVPNKLDYLIQVSQPHQR